MQEQSKVTSDPPSPSGCVIGEEWFGRVVVVAVSGVVDMLTSPQLEESIATSLAKSPTALVVDLTDVEFLASAGMGVLVAAHDKATPEIAFGVVADGPVTSRPLKLVGIADIVGLYATRDEALANLTA